MTHIFGDTGFCQPLNTTIADLSTTDRMTPLFIMDLAKSGQLQTGDVIDAWLEFQVTTNNDDRPLAPSNNTFEYVRIGSICAFMCLASDATLNQSEYAVNRISGNTGTNIPFLIHHQPVRQHGRFIVTNPNMRYLIGVAYAEANKPNWQPLVVNHAAGECRMCYTITRGELSDGAALGNGSDLIQTTNGFGVVFQPSVSGGSNGWAGYTSRAVIQPTAMNLPSGSPTHIKVTLKAASDEGYAFDKVYVGHGGGSDAYDFSDTPVALDFSGNAGASLSAGAEITGTATFSYNKTLPLIISEHCSGSSANDKRPFLASVSGVTMYYKASIDEASTQNVSGYSSYSGVQLISKIEMDGF